MDAHTVPSSVTALITETSSQTGASSRNGSPTRHLSQPGTQSTPQGDESTTYTLCLLGSLQHFAYGATSARIKEIPLQLDSAVRHVSCGPDWLCLLTDAGRLYSFGSNTYGQLAQGHTHAVTYPKPILFSPDKRIVKVSCGACHGGLLLESGALFMFGCGSYGRLGTGNETTQSSPVAVRMRWRNLETAAAERTREPRTTIPGATRSVDATSEPTTSRAPADDNGNDDDDDDDDDVMFVDVSCGDRHTLLLGAKPVGGASTSSSSVVKKPVMKHHIIACGDGMNGRLGLGAERDAHTGALLTQFRTALASYTPTFASVHAGAAHNAAISTAGELFTWGNGADGQLGHGSHESEWVPRDVAFFRGNAMASAQCGAKHTLAVSRTGVVYAWGRGGDGQLGTGTATGTGTTPLPQRVPLVVDPVAAQQAQIDAQLATGASTGNVLVVPDTRVVVRTIVACDNMAMALDEQHRLFVWGDNAAGQLGVYASRTSQQVEDGSEPVVADEVTTVATPVQLSYMDLREPRKLASRVRDRVLGGAGAGTALPRVALAHVAASGRFSALLFRTKALANALGHGALDRDGSPAIVRGASSVGAVTRQLMRQQSTLVYGLDDQMRWQLSLTEPLQLTDVPSREASFYNYMAQYRVSIRRRPTGSDHENDSDDDDDHNNRHRHHPHRRASHARSGNGRGSGPHGTYNGTRRTSVTAMTPEMRAQLQAQFHSVDAEPSDDDDSDSRHETSSPRSARAAAETVKGFDAWLERQRSPSKATGFGSVAPRFATAPVPRHATSSNQKTEGHVSAPTRPQSSSSAVPGRARSARRTAPTSAFGRSVVPTATTTTTGSNGLPRRPTTAASALGSTGRSRPSTAMAAVPVPVPSTPSAPPSKDTRQRLFNQFVAPFGSSVASRFGVRASHPNDTLQLDIDPEQSRAALLPRSPGAAIGGNAEQFSQVIARRLHDARGLLPGPGTYDRHGG